MRLPLAIVVLVGLGAVAAASTESPLPSSYCTTMAHPLSGGAHGTTVCFVRNPAGWLELMCISNQEVAVLYFTEWCGRSPPAGVPTRGRAMPVPK